MNRRSLILFALFLIILCQTTNGQEKNIQNPLKIAAVVTAYYHNSHADVIVSRMLETDTLDGKGKPFAMKLVGLYTDQVPDNDKSRELAKKYEFPIYETVRETLTLGTDKLAVDGVLLVAEHGNYPWSDTEQILYPKRKLFEQIVKVFEDSDRVVPVFIDKHLADNWEDANWIYQTAQRMKIPLMAGSTLPVLWRYPAVDVKRGAKLKEIVGVSYHLLDTYGFHSLEMMQCLAERRQGDETGVKAVKYLSGDAVWEAGKQGDYSEDLLQEALARLNRKPRAGKTLPELVKKPELFHIEYADGLKASILTLNGAVSEWSIAWREAGEEKPIVSTLFDTQEARPFMHFSYLTRGVEQMMLTGKSTWPVERTLMTSGLLNSLMRSRKAGGERLETPYLMFPYRCSYDWTEPPVRPADRPIPGQ